MTDFENMMMKVKADGVDFDSYEVENEEGEEIVLQLFPVYGVLEEYFFDQYGKFLASHTVDARLTKTFEKFEKIA